LKFLLVNDNVKNEKLIRTALEESSYEISRYLKTSDDLLKHIGTIKPDAIVIDTKTPDDVYLNQIKTVNEKTPTPIVMFTDNSGGTDTIKKAVKEEVHAYIVDGLESERIRPIIETAIIRFKEFQSLRNELIETKATLEERKKIERAKDLLMEKHDMKEPEAFQTLRKMAMDQNKKWEMLRKISSQCLSLLIKVMMKWYLRQSRLVNISSHSIDNHIFTNRLSCKSLDSIW